MAILFKCEFVCRDEKTAKFCHTQMMEALKRLSSEDTKVTHETLVESMFQQGRWESRAEIRLEDGRSDPEAESGEARRISEGIGAPWEKHEEGRLRVLSPGTGGFSDDFNLSKRIELRLEAADKKKKGFLAKLFG